MTKNGDTMKAIGAEARICWTCGGTPNPENFGGLCDPCDVERKQRLHRTADVLAERGLSGTQEGRALKFLGYGSKG